MNTYEDDDDDAPLILNDGNSDFVPRNDRLMPLKRPRSEGSFNRVSLTLASTAFLGSMCISMTWAPVFQIFKAQACMDEGLSSNCTTEASSEDGGNNAGTYGLVINGVNFLTIALLGELSDSYGRKPFLIASQLGSGGTLAALYFLGGRNRLRNTLYGITAATSLLGGQYAQSSGIFAMLGDDTADLEPTQRTVIFGKVVLGMYLGLVAGPIFGALMLQFNVVSALQLILISSVGFLVNGVALSFGTHETKKKELRTKFSWARANPFGGMMVLLSDSVTGRIVFLELGQYWALTGMLSCGANRLAALEEWGSFFYGSFFFASAFGNLFLPLLIKKLGVRGTLQLGCVVFAIAIPSFALPFYIGPMERHAGMWSCIFALTLTVGGMWDAPCRALAVARHPESKIGLATAGLVGIQSFAQGTATKGFLYLDSLGPKKDIPWLAYAVAGGCAVLALMISLTIPNMTVQAKS